MNAPVSSFLAESLGRKEGVQRYAQRGAAPDRYFAGAP